MSNALIVDNYDSFVYNIAQYIGELGASVSVVRNDTAIKQALLASPERIILSPGPGHPRDSGLSLDLIETAKVPILGICLGHQAIGYSFGAKIVRGKKPIHGKTSAIIHKQQGIFAGLESPINATRYHSLVIDADTIPSDMYVLARTYDGTIMAIQHQKRPIVGVQFHPESILTQGGKRMLRNFMEM